MKLKHPPELLILVGGGLLMLVDTLLGWQSIDVGGLTYSRNAWHGFVGIVLGLMAVAFFLNAIAQAEIVEVSLRLPHRLIAMILAPAIFVFAVIKNIDDDHSAWPAYVGFVLAGALTYGAWTELRKTHEVKAAKTAVVAPTPSPPAETSSEPKTPAEPQTPSS